MPIGIANFILTWWLTVAGSYLVQVPLTAAMTMPKLQPKRTAMVLVDPVTEWKQVVEAGKRMGHTIIAVSMVGLDISDRMKKFLPTASTLKEAGVDHVVSMHHRDVYSCVHALKLLLVRQQEEEEERLTIQGIIPLSELAVDVSDLLAACFNLPHNPLDTLMSRRDKGFMKESVAAAGLRIAKFARIASVDELQHFLSQNLGLAFPIVIKTPQGFSSTDVYICQSLQEAQSALQSIVGQVGPDGRRVDQALVEEYIGGTEFAVNLMVLMRNGDINSSSSSSLSKLVCVTDVWKYDKNDQARYSSAEICDPNDPSLTSIVAYAKQVAQAVGIQYGAAHVELKAQNKICNTTNVNGYRYEDPVMMEVGARLSGGRKATMTQAAVNDWDPFIALIQSHCGQQVVPSSSMDFTPNLFVRHVFLPIEEAGKIQAIEWLLDTTSTSTNHHKLTTLHSSAMIVKVGDTVSKTTDITSCAGFVWLVGEREQVNQETEHVLATFKLVVVTE
jgi:biotin carboxylase